MWTEQTVEILRKLALEGKSAAWIAAALGAPSRSAVIGKANRIGIKLNGAMRAGPIGGVVRMEPPPAPVVPWGRNRAVGEGGPRSDRRTPADLAWGRSLARSRARAPVVVTPKRRAESWMYASAEVGEMPRIGLAAIGELQCRWPLGDPADDDFAYCGLQVARGHAYCAGHCRMAYRPPNT